MRVAVPATTAFGDQDAFTGFGEIVEHLAGLIVVDDRSHRHGNLEVFAGAAVPIAAFAVATTVGAKQ